METKTTTLATTLVVRGMTCPSCVAHVNRALRDLDGVANVDVRLREGTVTVKHEESAPIDALVEALREAGYPSSPKS